MSEDEKAARAEDREAVQQQEAVAEQRVVDDEARLEMLKADPQGGPYSREANNEVGGESFAYGSPAPGAGPDK